MRDILRSVFLLSILLLLAAPPPVLAQQPDEKRIALVIGNAGYTRRATLATPANDAGLVAQTLQAAGFDVVGARDLDQEWLRRAFRDFLEKATPPGPNTVAFIYLSGYGLQLKARTISCRSMPRLPATPMCRSKRFAYPTIRGRCRPQSQGQHRGARCQPPDPFAKSDQPLAGGLALVDPEPNALVAFNTAPGTVAPERRGPTGPMPRP